MKNIHLIPTDKPSRLIKNNHSQLLLTIQTLPLDRELGCFPQNIYITSDEFIEEGDFGLNLSTKNIVQYDGIKGLDSYYKKIILTTDQDLIKDGVQAIDDTFLEWFVNNPSCEWVDVKYQYWEGRYTYKIIIPKQLPTVTMEEFIKELDEKFPIQEPKQETLEEAVANYANYNEQINKAVQEAVKFGAKWQAERMYSEEDLLSAFKAGMMFIGEDKGSFKEWFKQFKKK
jgi:hypothetical protein